MKLIVAQRKVYIINLCQNILKQSINIIFIQSIKAIIKLLSCDTAHSNIDMIPKESIITPQILKQRDQRNRKLMKMIKNYKRTNEEIYKLQRIKDNTVLQINLRYLRCQHNRNYVFPKDSSSSGSDQEINSTNPFSNKSNQFYDLRAQNQIIKPQIKPTLFTNESGRRVKSLDREKNDLDSQRLGRFEQTKGLYSYKKLRKKSVVDAKRVFSTIKLPGLNKKQNSKNQTIELQKIVGRKLITQTSSPQKNQFQDKTGQKLRQTNSKRKFETMKKRQ